MHETIKKSGRDTQVVPPARCVYRIVTALALYAPKLGVICDMEIAKRDMLKKFPKGCFFSVAKNSQRDIHFRRHNKKELAL